MGITLVIAGSIRPARQSFVVAEYALARLRELGAEAELIDLRDWPLPPFDGVTVTPASEALVQRCLEAEAFLFVAPEWHAGIPGTLKNLFDFLGAAHFSGKPVGLIGVSSGMGGAMVISHLRDVTGVLGALLVGPFVPFRNVKTAFDRDAGRPADPTLEAGLTLLFTRLIAARGVAPRE